MVQTNSLEVYQFPCRSDNYGLLLYDAITLEALCIDTPEETAILEALKLKGLRLTHILNTHHHYDHVEANQALKQRFNCQIIGSKADQDRIPAIDQGVEEGDIIHFAGHDITVLETSGHTIGHVSYWVKHSNLLFVGDTLFSMGCGRLFEGDSAMMWQSLQKIIQLPPETMIYCAHEYTMTNGEFALEIEPENKVLQQRMDEVRLLRRNGKPTLPVRLDVELNTNPFLRPDSPEIQKTLGLEQATTVEVFTKLRELRNNF